MVLSFKTFESGMVCVVGGKLYWSNSLKPPTFSPPKSSLGVVLRHNTRFRTLSELRQMGAYGAYGSRYGYSGRFLPDSGS
jgi:hypothetical protein